MKTTLAFFLLFSFIVSACTFNMTVLTPAPSQPTPLSTQSSAPVAPSPTATISATAELLSPTPLPTTNPVFTGAFFTLNPVSAANQSAFAAGTREIFAIWNYQNLRDGAMIKREWYLNGQLWLVREEPWDFAKYGANGTIRTISIHDYDASLLSGVYQLKLYIDNAIQPIGSSINGQFQTWAEFQILPTESITEKASPNFQGVASVLGGNKLSARDANGAPTVLYTTTGEIAYFLWFPDSQHILFVDRFHVDPGLGAEGNIQDVLEVADVVSKQVTILHESDAPLGMVGEPLISPNGKYIATSEGSGNGDACFIPLKMIFFEITNDFQRGKTLKQEEFVGLPSLPDVSVYPVEPGSWQGNTEFAVPLKVTCTTDDSLFGSYVFNMTNLTAKKK